MKMKKYTEWIEYYRNVHLDFKITNVQLYKYM